MGAVGFWPLVRSYWTFVLLGIAAVVLLLAGAPTKAALAGAGFAFAGAAVTRFIDIAGARMTWNDREVAQVLQQGADALRLEFDIPLTDDLLSEAFGSVGLLQRLAAQLCIAEGIRSAHHGFGKRKVAKGPSLETAKQAVAEQMQGRFQNFADDFVRGITGCRKASRFTVTCFKQRVTPATRT